MGFLILYQPDGIDGQLVRPPAHEAFISQNRKLFVHASYPWKTVQSANDDGSEQIIRLHGSWEGELVQVRFDNEKIQIELKEKAVAPVGIFYAQKADTVIASDDLTLVKNYIYSNRTTRLNDLYIYCFTVLGGYYVGQTPYEDIHRLKNGYTVRFDGREWSKETRYYIPDGSLLHSDPEYYQEGIYRSLTASLKKILDDEPVVGVSLSGGLDSTSILGLASEVVKQEGLNTTIHSVTWQYKDSVVGNERKYIQIANEFYDVEGIIMEDASIFGLEPLTEILTAHRSWFPVPGTSVVFAERVRSVQSLMDNYRIRRILTGHGGDFLFDAQRLTRNSFWGALKESYAIATKYQSNMWAEFMRLYFTPFVLGKPDQAVIHSSGQVKPAFVRQDHWEYLIHEIRSFLHSFTRDVPDASVKAILWDSLLYDDLENLGISARNAHPFLDDSLLTQVLNYTRLAGYPAEEHEFKPLLKKMMHGKLPAKIASRKNKSRADWMMVESISENKQAIMDIMQSGWLQEHGWIEYGKWKQTLDELIEGKSFGIDHVLQPLSVELWIKHIA